MNNPELSNRLAALLAVCLLVLPLLVSCHGDAPKGHAADAHYMQIDSALRGIRNVDTLQSLLRGYQDAGDDAGVMLASRHLGERLRFESRFAESLAAHHMGYNTALRLGDTIEMALMLNNIGTVYRRTGRLDSAVYYHYSALRLCEQFGGKDDPEAVECHVKSLIGIGNVELSMHNYSNADSVLHLALASELELSHGNDRSLALIYSNLGEIRHFRSDNDSAMFFYTKSLECSKRMNDAKGVALSHAQFGEVYESENRLEQAMNEYSTAHVIMKQKNDMWHGLDVCMGLARVSLKTGNSAAARAYIAAVDSVAHAIGAQAVVAQALALQSQLAELDGDHKRALSLYRHSKELEDSIYGWSGPDVLRDQAVSYERMRSMAEKDTLSQDIARQRKYRAMLQWLVTALAVMSALAVAALVYVIRTRARSQQVMMQIEETRNLFFTNVAHQLRTPLTAIMSAVDTIVASQPPAGKENYNAVDVIGRQGNNLLLLVDRILEVGDVHSAIVTPEWRRGDAVAFVRMVVDGYRDNCVEKHLELTYSPRENGADIDVVPRYLGSIVGRLLENAIAYSPEFSRITVTTSIDKGRFVICVADNGMGIDKKDLPHVVEPFFRGAVAEQMVEGVGIGLTVVHDMCLAMGGTVTVDSKLGNGTVVTVSLPCRHGNAVKQRLEEYSARVRNLVARAVPIGEDGEEDGATAAQGGTDRPVVLIVEDHNDVAHLVGAQLGTVYDVHYATNGERGLYYARELKPELIVTNMNMPIMDGLEMCRRIRASRHLAVTPVIMLSAHSSVAERVKAIQAGADIYLTKPADSRELRHWADHLVQRHRVFAEYCLSSLDEEVLPLMPRDNDSLEDTLFLERFVGFVELQSASGNIKLDLDRFAREMKMGETQVKRRIQALTGMTTTAYITHVRMARALRLIRLHPDMRVGDVAEQCGFADVAYFSRAFRQHHGMTPTQARTPPPKYRVR